MAPTTQESRNSKAPLPDPREVAAPLLEWYEREGRKLPWRDIGDPYRILVSEIMLQQTRVSTVLNYYPSFIDRFPTVGELAAASEEEVLAMWSGLGFYRRARNLHACAQELVKSYGSEVPSNPENLGKLPGIGRYTVGAILSAAHNAKLPILDGNVIRVLSRVFYVEGDPKSAKINRRLWSLAEAVLPQDRPGDFNQAIMDLGATVCSRTTPRCQDCPLCSFCAACKAACAEDFPHAGRKTKVVLVQRISLFVTRPDGAFLLHRRGSKGLLAGMWELPSADLQKGEQPQHLARVLSTQLGLSPEPQECGQGEHRFSHRHWTTRIYRLEVDKHSVNEATLDDRELRWTHTHELQELALPEATRKTLRPCLSEQPSPSESLPEQ